jgi:hypothetical protein
MLRFVNGDMIRKPKGDWTGLKEEFQYNYCLRLCHSCSIRATVHRVAFGPTYPDTHSVVGGEEAEILTSDLLLGLWFGIHEAVSIRSLQVRLIGEVTTHKQKFALVLEFWQLTSKSVNVGRTVAFIFLINTSLIL